MPDLWHQLDTISKTILLHACDFMSTNTMFRYFCFKANTVPLKVASQNCFAIRDIVWAGIKTLNSAHIRKIIVGDTVK